MQTPEDQLDYQEAKGSGAAAVLAFLHIASAGMTAYGSWHLARNANEALLASPQLWWQFFLPIGIGLFLYLPTNPLSKALAATALGFAVIGVWMTAIAVVLVLTDPTRQFEEIATGRMYANLAVCAAVGLALGGALRLAFRRLLPPRDAARV